jgi:hypothetical protein
MMNLLFEFLLSVVRKSRAASDEQLAKMNVEFGELPIA